MDNKPKQPKKIRKGDRVVAIAGNNRGLSGVVQSLHGDRVTVQGLNIRKKHMKKAQENAKGQIIEIERPIHISNVMVCVEGDQAAKLKVRSNEQGVREYVYQSGDEVKVYRSVKKPK